MKYAVVVIAMLLAACPSRQEIQQSQQNYTYYISYIKDTKPEPDICFAAVSLGGTTGVMSTVPCEAVEHLLETQEKVK